MSKAISRWDSREPHHIFETVDKEWKMKNVVFVAALVILGCGEEDTAGMECETTVECSDEKEMFCDEPVSTEFEDGTVVQLRACTYATYENCFEKTVCRDT